MGTLLTIMAIWFGGWAIVVLVIGLVWGICAFLAAVCRGIGHVLYLPVRYQEARDTHRKPRVVFWFLPH